MWALQILARAPHAAGPVLWWGMTITAKALGPASPENVFSKHGLFFPIFPLFRVLSWTILWRSHPTTTSILGLEDFLAIGQFYWGGGLASWGCRSYQWAALRGKWKEPFTEPKFVPPRWSFKEQEVVSPHEMDTVPKWYLLSFYDSDLHRHACLQRAQETELWSTVFLQYTLNLLKKLFDFHQQLF